MKQLIKGEVSYYQYFNPTTEMGVNEFYLEKGGKLTLIKTGKFHTQLSEYFKDAPELSEKIRLKKFKKSQTAQIVQEYNQWVESQWK
jgi:UTP-glucose-1-phosphate uridylyltransferase